MSAATRIRRVPRIRLLLAAAVVLGIGAVATTAAFTGSVTSPDVPLRTATVGLTAGDWTSADTSPATALEPGDVTTRTLTLHNASDVPVSVTTAVTATGDLAGDLTATVTGLGPSATAPLDDLAVGATDVPAGADRTVSVRYELPADAPDTAQGRQVTVSLTFTATGHH